MSYKNKEDRKNYMKQYMRKYRSGNYKKIRKYERQRQLKKKFSLCRKDREGLWYSQDGRCAICDKFFTVENVRDICVDHDHKTGEIRGLLCQKCNRGLGHFDDDIKLLKNVIEYLKTFSCFQNETNSVGVKM